MIPSGHLDERFFECFPWEYAHSLIINSDFDLPKCKGPTNIEKVIRAGVEKLWSISRFANQKISYSKQHQVINALRVRYCFPDILGLIGEPNSDHYEEDGELVWKRKAQLLLIGRYEWQGMAIATHKSVQGYCGDYWCIYPAWEPNEEGWHVALETPKGDDRARDFFLPFRNTTTKPLLDYIAEQTQRPLEARECVLPIDGNVFNVHPDNIRIVSTRGRPMRCKRCTRRVTKEASARVQVDGEYGRFCKYCLDTLIDRGDISIFL